MSNQVSLTKIREIISTSTKPLTANEIVKELAKLNITTTKKEINRHIYGDLKNELVKEGDSPPRWSFKNKSDDKNVVESTEDDIVGKMELMFKSLSTTNKEKFLEKIK